MSFENGMFAQETADMSLQIEACLWRVSLSSLEADNVELETHYELSV